MRKTLVALGFATMLLGVANQANAASCYYWPGDLVLGRGGYGFLFDVAASSYWTHAITAENFGYHYQLTTRVVHTDKFGGCGDGAKSEVTSSLMNRNGYEDTWVKWKIADTAKLNSIVSWAKGHIHGAGDNPNGECSRVGDAYDFDWCNYGYEHEYFCTELVHNAYESNGVNMSETWHVVCFGGSSQDPEELGEDFPGQDCYYWNQQ